MINFTQKSIKKGHFTQFLSVFIAISAILTLNACSKSGATEQEQMISFAKSNNINFQIFSFVM